MSNISLKSICFRVPFDWKTPFGFFLLLIIQAITCLSTTYPCKATLCYLIGSFWALLTIAKDITRDLDHLNTKKRHFDKHFYEVVQLFTNVKELSGMISGTAQSVPEENCFQTSQRIFFGQKVSQFTIRFPKNMTRSQTSTTFAEMREFNFYEM